MYSHAWVNFDGDENSIIGRYVYSMVGLFGIFQRSGESAKEANERILKRMLLAMNPEPGYLVDTFCDEHTAIGRAGLGVLNRSPQPLCDSGKRYFLFMDGQIFAYEALKKQLEDEGFSFAQNSEEEVVLNLFLKHGEKTVQYLNGVFLIVIYDSWKETLYIMNSRCGLEYLYYHINDKEIIFASSIRAILATGKAAKRINEKAIYDFFKFEFVTGDDTFFKDIQLFPYASTCRITRDAFHFNRYWDYPRDIADNKRTDIHALVEEGSFLLERAVARQLKENIKAGVTLSGGLDSRTISGYLNKLGQDLNVFHLKGWGSGSESRSAKAICTTLHGRWHAYDLNALDYRKIIPEGIMLSDGHIACGQFKLLDCIQKIHASQSVNYILDGFVMDILFQPLFIITKQAKAHYSLEEMTETVLKTFASDDDAFMRAFFPKSFYDKFHESVTQRLSESIKNFGSTSISCVTQYFHFTNRARRFVFAMPIVNRAFVEYGFPGLDYDLFDFGLSIPLDYRLNGELYRQIIMRDFPPLGRIPWPLTGLALQYSEPSAMHQWKKNFQRCLYYGSRLSNGRWEVLPRQNLNYRFRKDRPTREFFLNILQDEKTLSRGYMDKKGMEKLIQHQDSGRNYASALCTLVNIELWHRYFYEDGHIQGD